MILIAFIIVLILIYREFDEKRKKEIEDKKKNIIGYDTRTGIPLYKGEKVIGYNTQTGQPIIEGREEPKKETKPIEKAKISNSILMIVGAGLVVFATIVFLMSSWDSIPNIIKPFMLVFIQIIFYVSHLVCVNKLDIPKTGKVFKFLSFMFVPIVLLSLSCFELIGEDLSIHGDYDYLYFAFSFLLSDIIFKTYDKLSSDIIIKRTSYFLEAIGVICLTKVFNADYGKVIIFAFYTSIIHVLTHFNILDKNAYKVPNLIMVVASMILSAILSSYIDKFLYYMPFAIYTVTFFAIYISNQNENKKKADLYFFIINYLAFVSAIDLLTIPNQFIYLLCLIPFIVLAKTTKSQSLKEVFIFLVFGITTLALLSSLFKMDGYYEELSFVSTFDEVVSYYNLLTTALAAGIYSTLFLLTNKLRPMFKCFAYATLASFFFNLCNSLDIFEAQKYVLILVAVLIYLIEEAFPRVKDITSPHIVPIILCLESILLGLATLGDESLYTVIIPFILMIIYSRLKEVREEYLLLPTLATISLFFKTPEPLSVGICSFLVLLYSLLSTFKRKANIYTFVSLVSIIIGLPVLKANFYIVFLALGVWSIVHLIAFAEHKEIFKLTAVASCLGLYLKVIDDLDVGYISIYFLGLYLALMATTRLVFKKEEKAIPILECISFIILTMLSLIMIEEPIDAILMIIILFIITLFSFINKYKTLLYCSLAGMIIHILKQTLEFWASIPIYIYVLVIGLTLILFAMFDEKLNINKKNKEKSSQKDNVE